MSKRFFILLTSVPLITFCSAGSILQAEEITQPVNWGGWFCPNVSRPKISNEIKCYKLLAQKLSLQKAGLECAALKKDTDLFTPTILQINAEWEEFDAGIAGIILERSLSIDEAEEQAQARNPRTTVWTGPTEYVTNRTSSGFGHCFEYNVENNQRFTAFRYVKAPCSKEKLVLCQTYPYKVTDLLGRLAKLQKGLEISILETL